MRYRSLRVILAAFLVPVVWMSTGALPAVAQPVDDLGAINWTGVRWEGVGGEGGYGYGNIDCGASVGLDGPRAVFKNLWCFGGADRSPFHSQPAEPGAPLDLYFLGTGCSEDFVYEGTLEKHPDDGIGMVAGQIEAGSWDISASCQPTQMCLTTRGTGVSSGSSRGDCRPVNLKRNVAPTGCNRGTPAPPRVRVGYKESPNTTRARWRQETEFKIENQLNMNGAWQIYVIRLRNLNEPMLSPWQIEMLPSGSRLHALGSTMPGSADIINATLTDTFNDTEGGRAPGGKIIGAGYFFQPNPGSTLTAGRLPQTGNANSSLSISGMTDGNRCLFYWGAKIAEIPNETTDDPAGPLPGTDTGGVPLPIPGTRCEAVECTDTPVEYPTTDTGLLDLLAKLLVALIEVVGEIITSIVWLAGEVVGAIESMTTALLGLVGQLITELSDLLKLLAVPNPGSWGISGLTQQWEARPPGSVVNEGFNASRGMVQNLRSNGNHCDGAYLQFNVDGDPGAEESSRIRCPVNDVQAYGTVYNLVSVALVGATGFVIFHVLRSAVET